MTTTEIESVLSHSPTITAPAMLKERLLKDIPPRARQQPSSRVASSQLPQSWLRRWLPILVPGGLSLACGVVLTMQRLEITDLKQSIHNLAPASQPAPLSPAPAATTHESSSPQSTTSVNVETDLARLRDTAAKLRSEVASLETMAAENTRLRQDLAKAAVPEGLTAEEKEALERARERATSIACINNLKQIGLAVRTWALDHDDLMPPNLVATSNELSTPKVLFCPADTNRVVVTSWNDFSDGAGSYTYYRSDKKAGEESNRVLASCAIHGHVCLEDGSVQGYVAKKNPSRLVQKDGSLYFVEPMPSPSSGAANPPSGGTQ